MTLLDAPFIFQIGGISAALTLLLSVPGVWLARRLALIDWPDRAEHKKHQRPVPLAGGIIITLCILVISPFLGLWEEPSTRGILIGGLIIMLFGAWDDRRVLPPWAKLVGQVVASFVVMASGVSVHFTARLALFGLDFTLLKWADWLITLVWLVGITNAFNLIDSMDGLVVGTSGVALAFFLLATFEAEQVLLVRMSALLLGICAGLYVHNVVPATFFLGDSGAQMLGFVMACLGILYSPPDYPQGSSWFVPILLLGVPIFDTTLVVYSRLRRHKPIYQGDLSHTYHRLVLLGLDTNRAVVTMHLAGGMLGCMAFVALSLPPWAANLAFGLTLLLAIIVIVFLERASDKKSPPPNNNATQALSSPSTLSPMPLRRWWLLVVCIVLGGLAGLLVHSFRPTEYEAETILIGSLNFPPSEFYTQYEEDYALTVAATHIAPLSMAPSLLPDLEVLGYDITSDEYIRSASLERKQSSWALRYRSADPDVAAAVVELWALQAYEKLSVLRDHALEAHSLYEQLRFLDTCARYAMISPPGTVIYPPDYQGVCLFSSAGKIHAERTVVSRLFAEQLRLSRSMNPYFVVDMPDTAGTQIYRTAYDRNLMALAGALIGLVAGLWLINIPALHKGRRV